MKFLTAALAVCVLALTACAGAGAPASGQAEPSPAQDSPSPAVVPSAAAGSPTSQPSIVVTPELTPATLTVEQAAASYKAIAKTYNKQLKRLQKKYANATSLAANRKFYAKLAEYEKAFLKGLKAIAFSADIQPDADRLIEAIVVYRRAQLSAAKATTSFEMSTATKAVTTRGLKAADLAAILRDDLGLPSN